MLLSGGAPIPMKRNVSSSCWRGDYIACIASCLLGVGEQTN
jgi:hypothetical protein